MQRKYGTTIWEERNLDEKLEGVGLKENSGFADQVGTVP